LSRTASFGRAHARTILLPGPAGRVPQENSPPTPGASRVPGGLPPGPPDAPPKLRGSAPKALVGGARNGPAGRRPRDFPPSMVHCCPPHPAAEEPPRRVRRGAWPPERVSQRRPPLPRLGSVGGPESAGGVPPRPPCRRGGRRRGPPLSTAAPPDRLRRRPSGPRTGGRRAARLARTGSTRPGAPGGPRCSAPPPGVPGRSPPSSLCRSLAARGGCRGGVPPPGSPPLRVQVPHIWKTIVPPARVRGVPLRNNLLSPA